MDTIEKRVFVRYEDSFPCELKISDNLHKGRVVNYSDGVGAILETAGRIAPNTGCSLNTFNNQKEFKYEIVWSKPSTYGLRTGIRRIDKFKGSLKKFRLADLLTGFQKISKTGILEVKNDLITKKIFLKDGNIVFASSNVKEDNLYDILLRKGRINIHEYSHAFRLFDKKKEDSGNILIKLGYLTKKELNSFVRYQLEEIISSLFAIDGTFEFHEKPVKDEAVTLNTSTADIIYKSIKSIKNLYNLEPICPSKDAILTLSPYRQNIFSDLSLEEVDKKILYYVNGFYHLELILLFSPCSEFETLKTICALLGTHIIKEKKENDPPIKFSLEEIFTAHDKKTPGEFLPKEIHTQATNTIKQNLKIDRPFTKIAVVAAVITVIAVLMLGNINKKSEYLAYTQKGQETALPAFRYDVLKKLSARQKKLDHPLPSFRDNILNNFFMILGTDKPEPIKNR